MNLDTKFLKNIPKSKKTTFFFVAFHLAFLVKNLKKKESENEKVICLFIGFNNCRLVCRL